MCTAFIREIHQRALEAGSTSDYRWMATVAMAAFDGDALVWFDQQSEETCEDWRLLRRALIERFCQNRVPTACPAAAPVPAAMPSPIVSPSERVNLITDADNPKFHIRVIAPAYSGFISKTLASTSIGNVCSLTSNPVEVQEWAEIHHKITAHVGSALPLYNSNSVKGSLNEWLCAVRSRTDGLCGRLTFGQYSIQTRRWSLAGEPATRQEGDFWLKWKMTAEGKITLPGFIFVITKLQDGPLALNVWSQRIWAEDDDAYVSELYLVKAI